MIIHHHSRLISALLLLLLINPSTSHSTSPHQLSSYGPISINLPSGVPGPTSRQTLLEFELADARQALLNIKKKLGPEALRKLVQSEIEEADIFWHEIIDTTPNGTYSVSDVTVEALVSPLVLNTTIFLQWLQTFATDGKFPNRLVEGEPQHYLLNVTPRPEVIESWGALIPVTHFTESPGEKKAFMVDIPPSEFPVQMFVTLNLRDGTLIADEIMALRDNDDKTGMRIRFVTYFPGALGEERVEGVRRHVAVELGNWMRFAWEDVVSGRFVPS